MDKIIIKKEDQIKLTISFLNETNQLFKAFGKSDEYIYHKGFISKDDNIVAKCDIVEVKYLFLNEYLNELNHVKISGKKFFKFLKEIKTDKAKINKIVISEDVIKILTDNDKKIVFKQDLNTKDNNKLFNKMNKDMLDKESIKKFIVSEETFNKIKTTMNFNNSVILSKAVFPFNRMKKTDNCSLIFKDKNKLYINSYVNKKYYIVQKFIYIPI
jgi:hypothetical protein